MVQSSLIYTVVAVGANVLAEHAICSGNFNQVTKAILERIPTTRDSKMTYVYEEYLFHYICEDSVVYLCMADSTFGRRIPFTFLMEIKTKFREYYSLDSIKASRAFGMNDFSKILARQMTYYNNNPQADKIQKVQAEVDSVKEVVAGNIERVLERGERFENLVEKAETLKQSTYLFRKNAEILYTRVLIKSLYFWALLAMGTFAVLYIGIGLGCGFPNWQKCFINITVISPTPSSSPKAGTPASSGGAGGAASPSAAAGGGGGAASASPSSAGAAASASASPAAASASPSPAAASASASPAAASASASPAAASASASPAAVTPSPAAASPSAPAVAFLARIHERQISEFASISPSPSRVRYLYFSDESDGNQLALPAPSY